MPLPLDLNLLESDKKFQQLCFRLAQKDFPKAIPAAHGSWDGGRDIIAFNVQGGDVVWQCKFSQQSLSRLKPKVLESLNALNPNQKVFKWILCVSADGSGHFLDWLRATLSAYPFIASWELWDREVILQRLEEHPDVMEVFFYPVWKSLESRFRTDELELVRFQLEPDCGWRFSDPAVLQFHQKSANSDLVLDSLYCIRSGSICSTCVITCAAFPAQPCCIPSIHTRSHSTVGGPEHGSSLWIRR
jgi:hypothetical protein